MKRKEPMSPSQTITLDLNLFQTSLTRGMIEGMSGVMSALSESAKNRHDVRNIIEENVHKVWELDGEVKLLKGMMTSLIGTGDGSSGMVPRLEKEMTALGKDVASVKVTIQEVQSDVNGIKDDIKAIRHAQQEQQEFVSEIRGGSVVGKFLIGMSITVIGCVISGLLWLVTHGVKP